MNVQDPKEWQAPPLPEEIRAGESRPRMTEAGTLGSIFYEPAKTFEDLRRKPRFVFALLGIIVMLTAFNFAFYHKVGEENFRSFVVEQMDRNPQTGRMNAEQRANAVDLQLKVMSVIRYATPVLVIIGATLIALLYWLGAKAFGGAGGFMHAVSVTVYSWFPPAVVSTIAVLIVLAFKPVEEINIAQSSRGLLQASPAVLMDGKSMPVLTTLVGTLDLFFIWGWVLAAIGLQRTNRISAASAWAITIVVALIGVTFRVIGALMSGNPT